MRILTISLVLILAVGVGYAQTPEEMKLRVTMIDPAGKPIPEADIDRFHVRDMSDEPIYARIVPHDGTVTVVLPTEDKAYPRNAELRMRNAESGTGNAESGGIEASAEWRVRNAEWRVRNAEWGGIEASEIDAAAGGQQSAVSSLQSALPIPHSAIPIPHSIVPFQVCAMLNVPGFGEVAVYADGKGKGYSGPGTVDFVTEAAATRLLRVRNALRLAEREGVRMPKEFREKLDRAEKLPPYESLAITLAAGEEITLERARHRIDKLSAPRRDFIFGCNAFGYPARGPVYQQHFKEVFNLGITNVYISHFAPTETTRDYVRTDAETEWLLSNGMAVKPCPPFYMAGGVTPQWLRDKPHTEVPKIAHNLIYDTVSRYKGRTRFCEIMNEAHDYSNSLRLSPDELTLLAKTTSEAAREADPNVQRIINSCHLWGEYVVDLDKAGRVKRSPYGYLRDCIDFGVEFEIVGVQMYYPEYDLFEIDRLLDHFATLGKPIQLTEMGCQSAPGIDPNAQRKRASKGWHGPWTEEMQADWVEGIYTIAYSKPYVQGVSWWDLADAVSFWPYGGLLRGDCSPKPAFERLRALQNKWGVGKGVGGQVLGDGGPTPSALSDAQHRIEGRSPAEKSTQKTTGGTEMHQQSPIVIQDDAAIKVKVGESHEVMNGVQPFLYDAGNGSLLVQSQISVKSVGNRRRINHYYWQLGTVVSHDYGQTWTALNVDPDADDPFFEGGGIRRPDGSYFLLDTYITPTANPDEGEGDIWISRDGFKTIEKPVGMLFHIPGVNFDATKDDNGHEHKAMRLHRSLLELPNGDLLVTVYGCLRGDTIPCPYQPNMKKSRALLFRSHDGAKTWNLISTIAVGDVGSEGFDEPVLCRLESGRLICLMRTGRDLHEAISDDEGKTWTAAKPLTFPGIDIHDVEKWKEYLDLSNPGTQKYPMAEGALVDPDLLQLENGVLVCSVGVRIPEKGCFRNASCPRNGNYLAFSRDGGETWSKVIQLTSGVMTTHYTAIREIRPNQVFVTYDLGFWGKPDNRVMGCTVDVGL